MEVEKIVEEEEYWYIYFDDGTVQMQRKWPIRTIDYPMSGPEEQMCALCRKLNETKSEV